MRDSGGFGITLCRDFTLNYELSFHFLFSHRARRMRRGLKETTFQAKLAQIKKTGTRAVKHFIKGEKRRKPSSPVVFPWRMSGALVIGILSCRVQGLGSLEYSWVPTLFLCSSTRKSGADGVLSGSVAFGIKNSSCFLELSPVCCFSTRTGLGFCDSLQTEALF